MNPELQIQNVPAEAKSLALILHDPDAPMPGGFTHWVVWNIDPMTMLIKQESIPPGSMEGKNSAGKNSYIGPCPHNNEQHHYEFRLYALNEVLELPETTDRAALEKAMEGHIIEKTELVGVYKRI